MASTRRAIYAVLGDVHGHLQLGLCTLARWQRELGKTFDAVFLCGDVGTFTDQTGCDDATQRHARDNPCELEFQTQWSRYPQPTWLDAIFRAEPDGLGLSCPVVMVHGNHEGFAYLEPLVPRRRPTEPVSIESLPQVDSYGHIKLLPSGWTLETEQGYMVGGIGGMEGGQRRVKYHHMAYIEEEAVQHLQAHGPELDLLITHQGPATVQGDGHGSSTLDRLLERPGKSRFWFHGHSTPIKEPTTVGRTKVVPLGDIAFSGGRPGMDGWAIVETDGRDWNLSTGAPPFMRGVHLKQWHRTPEGLLVHPDLVPFIEA